MIEMQALIARTRFKREVEAYIASELGSDFLKGRRVSAQAATLDDESTHLLVEFTLFDAILECSNDES